jgi:hypothetical protein
MLGYYGALNDLVARRGQDVLDVPELRELLQQLQHRLLQLFHQV